MTEAGEKWAAEKLNHTSHKHVSYDYRAQAEFWIRNFCDDLEIRTDSIQKTSGPERLYAAFDEFKRELLAI